MEVHKDILIWRNRQHSFADYRRCLYLPAGAHFHSWLAVLMLQLGPQKWSGIDWDWSISPLFLAESNLPVLKLNMPTWAHELVLGTLFKTPKGYWWWLGIIPQHGRLAWGGEEINKVLSRFLKGFVIPKVLHLACICHAYETAFVQKRQRTDCKGCQKYSKWCNVSPWSIKDWGVFILLKSICCLETFQRKTLIENAAALLMCRLGIIGNDMLH